VPPGLLTVDPGAQGIATLGGGVTAAMYPSGLRLQRDEDILLETVIRGAPVSAVMGRVEGRGDERQEHVARALNHVHIESLQFLPGRAAYDGTVSDGEGRSLPLDLAIDLRGSVLQVTARVEGAQAVVVHLDSRPLTVGFPPVLPDDNLRRRAWWLAEDSGATAAAFRTILRTTVTIGPEGVDRGLDLRSDGRNDIHVWSATAALTVSSRPAPLPG
jgi:hypothetical protein